MLTKWIIDGRKNRGQPLSCSSDTIVMKVYGEDRNSVHVWYTRA